MPLASGKKNGELMSGLLPNSHGYVIGMGNKLLDFGDIDPIFKVTGNIKMTYYGQKCLSAQHPLS